MRRFAAALAGLAVLAPAQAAAAPVLVLDGDHVERREDPHLPALDLPSPRSAGLRAAGMRRAQSKRTVRGELARLLTEGRIDQATHDSYRATYNLARKSYKRLTGARRAGLGGALANAELIAAAGELTPSRLPAVFLTVARNRQWWTTGSLLSNGQRVEFSGSEIVWQNYSGQGIQIQVLGTFGRANGLWQASEDDALRALLDEMLALASDRGGVMAWEYLFRYGGGSPPWASGMAQATGVQALARAAERLGEPAYRDAAIRALALFETPAPVGVRVDGQAGPHYLLYSFAPELRVYNGFLQAVIGLLDAAALTGEPRAQALAGAGDAEARAELAAVDTGAWSLYSTGSDPAAGRESSLHYHRLVTEFLDGICKRTSAAEYCTAAERFAGYEDVAPVVRPLTRRVRAGRPANLRFALSKIARVRLEVVDAGGRAVATRSGSAGYGKRFFTWTPRTAGSFELRASATDLAGNASEVRAIPLEVLPAKKPRPPAGRAR
ncbi:MAG TPA: D-glucuronyl C5-epimerase family protein [Thermoleophilaceae bacterium]|jgi:hypothetical protein